MKKKQKVKKGKIFNFIKKVVRVFKKKPEIIYLSNTLSQNENAIFIANHSAASGPFTYELFFPSNFIPWGTYEMCGNYKMRWNYLYHVFYKQKLKYSSFKAFLLATGFGIISKSLYNASGLIPTYKDARLKNTFKRSFDVFDSGGAVLIFPEDSHDGYFEKPIEYFKGFVSLSKMYNKLKDIDLPVYNVYYSKKANKIIIDKPIKMNELLNSGQTETQVAELFLKNAYKLYENHIHSADEK